MFPCLEEPIELSFGNCFIEQRQVVRQHEETGTILVLMWKFVPKVSKGDRYVNVQEGLEEIRRRLVDNGAQEGSIKTVDAILKRASLPAASAASANSLLQLTRMLMRTPMADANPKIYNDFVKIEADLEVRADRFRAEKADEEAKPVPKLHKFYKEQKEATKKNG